MGSVTSTPSDTASTSPSATSVSANLDGSSGEARSPSPSVTEQRSPPSSLSTLPPTESRRPSLTSK